MSDDVTADEDLEEFLTHWYGPPKADPVVPDGAEPLPLRSWYGYTAAWQQELAKQNRALSPGELTVLEGKTVFYVEHHGNWLWGYGEGPNPEVFDRDSDMGAQWARTGERLDMFLWHMAVFEELFALLDQLGIEHSTVEHPPIFTVEEGRPWHDKIPGLHCKNLLIKDRKGGIWLVVMPAEKRADLARLEKVLAAPRFSFA